MKVNNYDIIAQSLEEGVGNLKELGDYAGFFSETAYEALEIEGELVDEEWCDLMSTEDGKIYAVAGDSSETATGDFYFKEIFDGVNRT